MSAGEETNVKADTPGTPATSAKDESRRVESKYAQARADRERSRIARKIAHMEREDALRLAAEALADAERKATEEEELPLECDPEPTPS